MGLPARVNIVLSVAMVVLAAGDAVANPRDDSPIRYSTQIAPILTKRCFLCHGPDASTRRANLRLDHRDGAVRGEDGGDGVVVPGSPQESALWLRITAADLDDRMPPADEGHPALTSAQIDLIETWIRQGAPYETHWSWQPLHPVKVPDVNDTQWPRRDLDWFILAELEDAGLAPAVDADPATRLRRLTFDLSGLPPDPETVAAFLRDPSPEAWESHVDRLLGDASFGETWGRHWLDLMRYAQTHGHEFDYPIPEAWRYRDWVVAALNASMGYDQFIREQICGDQLSQVRSDEQADVPQPVVATGWWWLSQGSHAPVDVRQDELDRIENQIDVYSRAFMGTTMACARCHDHKFDPVSQQDYYAMAGMIRSSRRGFAYLDPDGDISRRAQAVHDLVDRASQPDESPPSSAPHLDAAGARWVWDFGEDPSAWVPWSQSGWAFRHAHRLRGEELLTDGVVHVQTSRGQVHSAVAATALHGTARSPTFTIDADSIHALARGRGSRIRLYVDHFHLNEYNPLLFETMIQNVDHPDDWRLYTIDVSRYLGHQAYLEFVDDGDGFLAVDWVVHSDERPAGQSTQTPVRFIEHQIEPSVSTEIRDLLDGLGPPLRALAMEEGTPSDSPLLVRGDHRTPAELAPRALTGVFPGDVHYPVAGSGRMEAADRLLARDHPLTARVAVNRVWHHLMGRGLSSTPDDLGGMGSPPTHPELLDHLASDFQRSWSIKAIIKEIVMSRTYAMSTSATDPQATQIDPDGRLFSRARVRRLPAEQIRDSMLAVSGTLDRTIGGPAVPTHLRDSMQGRGRPDHSGPLDGENRRSIYLAVNRNFLDPFLTAFDMPIPATTDGDRGVSNVPAQGLILLNDPLTLEMASRFGARGAAIAADEPLSTTEGVAAMIELAYGRPARDDEVVRLTAAIETQEASWKDVAHAILASKEFLFLN